MRIAYFDCYFGAAGDMLNAALLGAGADESKWREELGKLQIDGAHVKLEVSDVMRCNLTAKKVDVIEEHHHDHHGHHDHLHGDHGHHHHRHLSDIIRIIQEAEIPDGATELAIRIFKRLAASESRVHGVPPEEVHFHEVGAVDSIIDIVGFAIAYDLLGIQKSYASAVAVGSGATKTEHGVFPVPGPATAYLLQAGRAQIASSSIPFECLTPTGAAILCEVVQEWGRQPAMEHVEAIGYGAGTKDPAEWPNVCRVFIADATVSGAARFKTESVAVVEANLDDFNPQALAFVMEKLFQAGALDVMVGPVVMKKGRSGHLLTVICEMSDRTKIQETILEETSSIGVRWHSAERLIAAREWKEVTLSHGDSVRIKIARDNDGVIVNMQPEFDDCVRYAEAHHLPVKDVLTEAIASFTRIRG